jgi:hypothetical protein
MMDIISSLPIPVKRALRKLGRDLYDARRRQRIDYFELNHSKAKSTIKEVYRTTSQWRDVASKLQIKKNGIECMASAFEHEDFEKAIPFNIQTDLKS